jgi:uncharacterized protein (DUF2062 family)
METFFLGVLIGFIIGAVVIALIIGNAFFFEWFKKIWLHKRKKRKERRK